MNWTSSPHGDVEEASEDESDVATGSSADDETSGSDESDDELNTEGELRRPKARYLFAARVFEAVQVKCI